MDGFPRIQLIDDLSQSLCLTETSPFVPKTLPIFSLFEDHCDDLIVHSPLLAPAPGSFEIFDSVTDLIQIQEATPPFFSSHRAILEHRVGSLRSAVESAHLRALTDRVSALERRFDWLVSAAELRDRKYTWKAEIKSPENGGSERKYKLTKEVKGSGKTRRHGEDRRNYKWTSEIKGGKGQSSQKKVVEVEEEDGLLKNYKCTVDIKDKEDGEGAPTERTYSYKASAVGGAADCGSKEKKKKKEEKVEKKEEEDRKKEEIVTRVVHIEEPIDQGAIVLRQVCALSLLPSIVVHSCIL